MLELVLALLCFVVTFVYNKKDGFVKRIFKSFFQVFCLIISILIILAVLFSYSYDLQDIYPKYPILPIFQVLEIASMDGVPLFYIISILILIKIDKKEE